MIDPNDGPPPEYPPGESTPPPLHEHNAQADLDIPGTFHRDFGIAADFTLPVAPHNSGLFYSNWIILIPFERAPFVQLELMRWKKYGYRQEIGLTWAFPDGRLIYRDTETFLGDGPHRLGVSMKANDIAFTVDGKPICHFVASQFFQPQDRLYFQLGTEVSAYGDRPVGTISHIAVKNDDDAQYHPAAVTCVYRGLGASWQYAGDGTFNAGGVFDPTKPYLRFTGVDPRDPCVFSSAGGVTKRPVASLKRS